MLRRPGAIVLLLLFSLFAIPAARAAEDVYSRAELEADAVRLRTAVIRIYEIGLKPFMTEDEKQALGAFEFTLPMPKAGDALMNFAATTDGRYLIMPVMSLKALEDLSTAYAWRYHRLMTLGSIDLYFAMLRYRAREKFPGGRQPSILEALDVPKDAYQTDKAVDELSLGLRNEAFAFIIAHELGHIRFKHKPISQISALQAQADESEADKFAFDLLVRTKTPALGAALFFQAQIYSLLHRHEFRSEEEWRKHVTTVMTHPLSVERIRAMADYMEGPLLRSRPEEAPVWRDIAGMFRKMTETLEDEELARCIVSAAKQADFAILKPERSREGMELMKRCWEAPR